MQRLSVIIMVVTAIAKVFGFLREWVLAQTFGAGMVSDAFVFAFNTPTTILSIFFAAFVAGFIPIFTRLEKNSEEKANEFMSNIMNIILIISVIVTGFTFLFPEVLVRVFVNYEDVQTFQLATSFLRITMFSSFFISIIQLTTSYLNVKESFILAAGISIPMNLVLVGTMYLANRTGVNMILPYGTLIAIIAQAMIIYGYAYKKGYRHSFRINFADENLKTMLVVSIPIILSSVFAVFGTTVTQQFSGNVVGGNSSLNYANKLIGFVQGIFITSISTITFPSIARHAANGDRKSLESSFAQAMSGMCLFVIPAAVAFFILSEPLITIVYGSDMDMTISIFRTLSLGVIAIGVKDIVNRIFYAYQNTKNPLYNSILYVVVLTILCFVLINVFNVGLGGLGVALTIANFVSMFELVFQAQRLYRFRNLLPILKDVFRIIIAALIMGVIVYFGYNAFASRFTSSIINLGLTMILGVGVYLIAVVLLKVSFVNSFLEKFKNKIAG